jgi:hypothetical protein
MTAIRFDREARLVAVVTEDFGDSPGAGREAAGRLALVPNGTSWRMTGQLTIPVPVGTRPGAKFRVLIEELPD